MTETIRHIAVASLAAIIGALHAVQPVAQAPLTPAVISSDQTIAQTAIVSAIMSNIPIELLPSAPSGTTLLPSTFATSTRATTIGRLPVIKLNKFLINGSTAGFTTGTGTVRTTAGSTPSVAAATANIANASQLLTNATATLQQHLGDVFAVLFKLGSGIGGYRWNYGDATIAPGGKLGPQFSATYNCDPPATDEGYFALNTSYTCTLTVNPLTGSDRRIQSKDFKFKTGGGQLTAFIPPSASVHLVSDEDDGGFAFKNSDTRPVTITSESFDVSFTGLSVNDGPVVLRLVDPHDITNYLDYHMETFSPDPNRQFSYAGHVTLAFPIVVGAGNQKLLPVDVLGVHKLSITGYDPTIRITLRSVTTDRPDLPVNLGAPTVMWSCKVVIGSYDPNVTSSAFATGEACTN